MWWTTDSRVNRQPIRCDKFLPSQTSVVAKSTLTAKKLRHLSLPVSVAQAAANLILQESNADCYSEIPRLRKDIRSLESALRKVNHQTHLAASSVDSLQTERRQHLETIAQLSAQLRGWEEKNEQMHQRMCEQRAWFKIAGDLATRLGRRMAAQEDSDAEIKIIELIQSFEQVSSNNQELVQELTSTSQEKDILCDVISDMEVSHKRQIDEAQQQVLLLQKRMNQNGLIDRSQVQQLNIRIVSQAAEIRSLQKKLDGMPCGESFEDSGYKVVLDDQPALENTPDTELNERLENSLQAVRTELDAAVHELKYAQAEANRLRQFVEQIQQQLLLR